MLPYPSGEPHIGHLKNYALGDAIAHFHRRIGQRVLHPMGYDAFGLPAENNAIKTGVHPREVDRRSRSPPSGTAFHRWGISIDWSARVRDRTSRAYYRWTQWIFLKLFERGPRVPQGGGGQVVPDRPDGARQRAGDRRPLRALRRTWSRSASSSSGSSGSPTTPTGCSTTSTTIDWPEHVKAMQRNWIGRSEGAEVDVPLRGARDRLPGVHDPARHAVRRDVLRDGARAPRRVQARARAPSTSSEVHEYVNHALTESVEARGAADKPKTGVPLGRTVTNPVNGEQIPMFVADYVLMEYGTGAIMAVPAHDQRDYEFAVAFGLPIRQVVAPADGEHAGGRGVRRPTPTTSR